MVFYLCHDDFLVCKEASEEMPDGAGAEFGELDDVDRALVADFDGVEDGSDFCVGAGWGEVGVAFAVIERACACKSPASVDGAAATAFETDNAGRWCGLRGFVDRVAR